MTTQSQNNSSAITISLGAVIFVGAVLIVAIGKKTGMIDYPTATHAANVAMGLMLAFFGNFFPKFVRPLHERLDTSARLLAADRWSGRVLVFAGLVYAALWLLAPLSTDNLKLVAPVFALILMGIVAANQVFLAQTEILPFQRKKPENMADWSRGGLFVVMHAIAWAFAMILADLIWGDASAIWMIVAFTVVNGILFSVVLAGHQRASRT